jgi:hypothetical protein
MSTKPIIFLGNRVLDNLSGRVSWQQALVLAFLKKHEQIKAAMHMTASYFSFSD